MDQMFLGCRMEGPNQYLWHMTYANDFKPFPQIFTKIQKHLWAPLGPDSLKSFAYKSYVTNIGSDLPSGNLRTSGP